MKHIYREGTDLNHPTLLLLHGTGGNEEDLLPLARMISPSSSVLSVRGNVLENGMPRFFRRLAEGVFDEEDLIRRTEELYGFLDEAAEEYGFDRKNIVAVGYSNGANIAASLLFHYRDALAGAVLHHPMVPRRGLKLPDLSELPVWIGAGRQDSICAPEQTGELQSLLEKAGAKVEVAWQNGGHQLTRTEVAQAAAWYENMFT
ncbi:phospholipase/carboxylesterase [Melghirimyces thermohalophilus]|uniref:Phospholipase/carboxylesterase n=1 Tax=Melghirimyces thermohalophilus TaxID=1236220 RepID=A0A1G6JMX4_9BACL|nr:alpha/beta hydrolase [Melghirimyces thermohalophilus]SDC20021.1 phospholipase/carboxylesterase [Melghirimyces thermohalophilus]